MIPVYLPCGCAVTKLNPISTGGWGWVWVRGEAESPNITPKREKIFSSKFWTFPLISESQFAIKNLRTDLTLLPLQQPFERFLSLKTGKIIKNLNFLYLNGLLNRFFRLGLFSRLPGRGLRGPDAKDQG